MSFFDAEVIKNEHTNLLSQPINVFGNSESDEFFLVELDKSKFPLFKAFANPALLSVLVEQGDIVTTLFDQSNESSSISDKWVELVLQNPEIALGTLNWALAQAIRFDTIQHEIFQEHISQVQTENVLPQLSLVLAHLLVALDLQSKTFYLAESLVDDRGNNNGNPFIENSFQTHVLGNGQLDILVPVAMSVLQESIKNDVLNWKIHNKNDLKEEVVKIFSTNPVGARILTRLTQITGATLEEILFGLNFLEFIPVNVSGKKSGFNHKEAERTAIAILESNNSGVRGFNGLIKFLSWLPDFKETNSDLSPNRARNYASVREPVKILRTILEDESLWRSKSEFVFFMEQIKEFEMPAAEGRAILKLIDEGVILLPLDRNQIKNEAILLREEIQQRANLLSLRDRGMPVIVGGKAIGLQSLETISKTNEIIHIPRFSILDVNTIQNLLEFAGITQAEIFQLNTFSGEQLTDKLKGIQQKINNCTIPEELIQKIRDLFSNGKISIRSSSLLEDQEDKTIGAGAFESVLNVNSDDSFEVENAIKSVLASNFSEVSATLREATSLPWMPNQFATILQEMVGGRGGVAHIKLDHTEIDIGESEDSITAGRQTVTVSDAEIQNLNTVLSKLQSLFGTMIDIEFVIDDKNIVHILQLRRIPIPIRRELNQNKIDTLPSVKPEDLLDIPSTEIVILDLTGIDVHTNMGELFKLLIKNRERIVAIRTNASTTSHLGSIAHQFGIKLIS